MRCPRAPATSRCAWSPGPGKESRGCASCCYHLAVVRGECQAAGASGAVPRAGTAEGGTVPTYQYACTDCAERLEKGQRFTHAPLTVCPACGGRPRKVSSPVGIAFKGSGFYRTDSRKDQKAAEPALASANGKAGDGASSSGPDSGSSSDSKRDKGGDKKTPVASGSSGAPSSSSSSSSSSSPSASKGAGPAMAGPAQAKAGPAEPGPADSALAAIAVIGGSGLYEFLEAVDEVVVETPFGMPSDPIVIGEVAGRRVAFLPRHGRDHRFPPHRIPYRANLWALRSIGVRQVIAPSAVGSLTSSYGPGTLAVPDQLADRTTSRAQTFYDEGGAVHVQFADPYCPVGRERAIAAAMDSGWVPVASGTLVVIEGPRFSTRAESRF